jgi:HupE/UreJ protein
MSEFLTYLQLGFHHVAAIGAWDHILFLCALAAVYRPRDWRAGLWVVTAFTVGHSLSLALVVTRLVELPTAWIEFLIPVTIVLTAIANLVEDPRAGQVPGARRAIAAVVFGLVHGAGFAEYLRALFLDSIAVPLVGFNLGIEAAQIFVLALIGLGLALADRLLGISTRAPQMIGFQRRVMVVSAVAAIVAGEMALTRFPH